MDDRTGGADVTGQGLFDLGAALLAQEDYPMQRSSIYLPNRRGNPERQLIHDIETWIEAAMHILARMNLGVTRLPKASGIWIPRTTAEDYEGRGEQIPIGHLEPEDTVLVYSFLTRQEVFEGRIDEIRHFLHKFGRETERNAVWIEFFGESYGDGQNGSGSPGDGELYCRIYSIEEFKSDPTS